MPRPATDKRERLAASALDMAYERGFELTTIADIAAHAGVASGSVYYYFKTKDDVGWAVVGRLAERYQAAMDAWDGLPTPGERIEAFVASYVADVESVREHGCPIATVTGELAKYSAELGRAAGEILVGVLAWNERQFAELGFAPDEARARALHLVAVVQGAAALSSALHSVGPLEHEAAQLVRWLRAGANLTP